MLLLLQSTFRQYVMIRLQTKQKVAKVKSFIGQLKLNPRITPFLIHSTFFYFGYIDFDCVRKERKFFSDVEKHFKQNRYQFLKDFIKDLEEIFIMVSDYVFHDDPLQAECSYFIRECQQFQKNFINEFKISQSQRIKKQLKKDKAKEKEKEKEKQKEKEKEKQREREREKQKQKQKNLEAVFQHKKSTFAQKVQMIYFFKAHQDNQHLIRQIGKHYNIGKQVDDQYVIKLDNTSSSTWLEIINRKQFG